MKKTLSLSEIAIGIFAVVLVCTFALQLSLNRKAGNRALAQTIVTYECSLDGNEYSVPPRCVTLDAISTHPDGTRWRCTSNCQEERMNETTPTPENPGWCFGNPRTGVMRFDKNTGMNGATPATTEELRTLNAGQEVALKWFGDSKEYYAAIASHGGSCVERPTPECGNFILEKPIEQCEGNIPCTNGAECKDCSCGIVTACGNGTRELGEECDDGLLNSSTALCHENCMEARCGDGIIDSIIGEQCDLGNSVNGTSGAPCSTSCKLTQFASSSSSASLAVSKPLFFMTTALEQSNALYFMVTQVMQWNLQSILAPFTNIQDFLFPQEIWSQILDTVSDQ